MPDTKINVINDEEHTIEIESDIADPIQLLQAITQSSEAMEYYAQFKNDAFEAFSYYEDEVIRNVDVLTRKIQTWDSETVKSVPADELEQTFLCLYDNIYILIQNVNPFWQVGMERLKLLKDYQDLYVEMLKVRGEL